MAKVIDRNVNVGVNIAQQIALKRRRSRGRYLARLRSKSVHYALYREIQRLLQLGILRDRADYEEEYEMEGEEGDDEPEDGEEGELSDDTYDDDKTDDDELDPLDMEVTDPDDIKKLLKIEMDKVFGSQEKVKTFITDEEIIKDWENFKKLCEKIWNALINVDFSRHILMLFDPELVREILKISEINLTEPSQKSNSNLIDKEKVLEILSREKLPENLYYIFPDLETVEKITRLLEKEYKEIADYIKDKISNSIDIYNKINAIFDEFINELSHLAKKDRDSIKSLLTKTITKNNQCFNINELNKIINEKIDYLFSDEIQIIQEVLDSKELKEMNINKGTLNYLKENKMTREDLKTQLTSSGHNYDQINKLLEYIDFLKNKPVESLLNSENNIDKEKIKRELSKLLLDRAFSEFFEKLEQIDSTLLEAAQNKLGSSELIIDKSERDNLVKVLTFLSYGVDVLESQAKGNLHLSKKDSFFSKIIDITKSNDAIKQEIKEYREDFEFLHMEFTQEIKDICYNLLYILKKLKTFSAHNNKLEAIAKILTGHYFTYLCKKINCNEQWANEALELIKKLSENIDRRSVKNHVYYEPIDNEACIIITEKENGELLCDIPTRIPDTIVVNTNIEGSQEFQNVLKKHERKCDILENTGKILCGEFPEVMRAKKEEELEEILSIFRIEQDEIIKKLKEIGTEIKKDEMSRIINEESLLTPHGLEIPLKEFCQDKKDLLDKHKDEIINIINNYVYFYSASKYEGGDFEKLEPILKEKKFFTKVQITEKTINKLEKENKKNKIKINRLIEKKLLDQKFYKEELNSKFINTNELKQLLNQEFYKEELEEKLKGLGFEGPRITRYDLEILKKENITNEKLNNLVDQEFTKKEVTKKLNHIFTKEQIETIWKKASDRSKIKQILEQTYLLYYYKSFDELKEKLSKLKLYKINEGNIETLKSKITNESYNILENNIIFIVITEKTLKKLSKSKIDTEKLKDLLNKEFTKQTLTEGLEKLYYSKSDIKEILKASIKYNIFSHEKLDERLKKSGITNDKEINEILSTSEIATDEVYTIISKKAIANNLSENETAKIAEEELGLDFDISKHDIGDFRGRHKKEEPGKPGKKGNLFEEEENK